MTEYIKNIYKDNSRFFISYEVGVMIGTIENSPTNTYMVESVERICESINLNVYVVSEGMIHYYKENSFEYNIEEINELLVQFGLGKIEL